MLSQTALATRIARCLVDAIFARLRTHSQNSGQRARREKDLRKSIEAERHGEIALATGLGERSNPALEPP